jgi:hypothetical protein
MMDGIEESYTEGMRRRVRECQDAGYPFGQSGREITEWLSLLPAKVREAIFLILDGHYAQDHRAHLKGAQTARARRRGAA